MCPKCNFHNYRSKVVCPQCSTPMPPGGNPPPGYGAAPAEDSSRRRKTKWDDDEGKAAKDVPDWLQDLVPKGDQKPRPPPGVAPENFKVMKMEGVQIRALIGKGGETIRDIRSRSGADIKIDHLPQDPEGTVTIVGEVEKTEQMIKDALATKGCPLGVPRPGPLAALPMGTPALSVPRAALALPDQADPNDVQVPPELVGPLIGPGGATIKEIRAKAGGAVYISVLPPAAPGGPQSVRIVGDQRESAKDLVRQKIEELKKMNQLGRPPAVAGQLPGAASGARPQWPAGPGGALPGMLGAPHQQAGPTEGGAGGLLSPQGPPAFGGLHAKSAGGLAPLLLPAAPLPKGPLPGGPAFAGSACPRPCSCGGGGWPNPPAGGLALGGPVVRRGPVGLPGPAVHGQVGPPSCAGGGYPAFGRPPQGPCGMRGSWVS